MSIKRCPACLAYSRPGEEVHLTECSVYERKHAGEEARRVETNKFIWSCYITDHEVMPHPRLVHGKVAQRIDPRTQKYLQNRDALAWLLKSIWRKKPLAEKILVRIEVGITNNRKSDWDNFAKTVCDSMKEGGVIEDDRWIDRGECTVFRGLVYPWVGIAIYEGGITPWIAKTNPTKINASTSVGTARPGKRTVP